MAIWWQSLCQCVIYVLIVGPATIEREGSVPIVVFLMTTTILQRKMQLVSLILFLVTLCPLGYSNVQHQLNKLTKKDRENLEFLFRYWIQRDTLGFLLFGESKCCTLTGIPITHKEYFLPYKIENGYQFQKKLKEAWYTWKRNESRFKHPNYLICEKYTRLENEIYLQLFIFDKSKLRATLDVYKADFIAVLGENFSQEQFIATLEKKKRVMPLIKHDEKLLGILLGFGRDASSVFSQWDRRTTLDPPLEYLGKRPPGGLITPVCFRGYKSSIETAGILEKYGKEILEIEKIFKRDTFFEVALEKFCSS